MFSSSRYCFQPTIVGSTSSSFVVTTTVVRLRPNTYRNFYDRWHYTYHGPGRFQLKRLERSTFNSNSQSQSSHHYRTNWNDRAFTVGIGGPVGSGKTALVLELCRYVQKQQQKQQQQQGNNSKSSICSTTNDVSSSSSLSLLLGTTNNMSLGVVTNDIFTQEDGQFLLRHNALPANNVIAIETGGCPHAAIREDVSANLSALETLTRRHYNNNHDHNDHDNNNNLILLCESGGDNLAANFSSDLADFTVYVIDVAGGDKVPRKGGPGITQSDLLVINKVDLGPAVGANLNVMERDARMMRRCGRPRGGGGIANNNNNVDDDDDDEEEETAAYGPIVLASIKHGKGVEEIMKYILQAYRRATTTATAAAEEEEETTE